MFINALVERCETFLLMPHSMTLLQGQGHKRPLKMDFVFLLEVTLTLNYERYPFENLYTWRPQLILSYNTLWVIITAKLAKI